ncbi:MAG: dihydroorotase [Myxococcota bacterium]
MSLVIRNGRLVDPKSGIDAPRDVVIADGRVSAIVEARSADVEGAQVIDATGRWVAPGFVELAAHFREPGHEYKEDLASGAAAAAAGGFTHVAVAPDTDPVTDNVEAVEFIERRGARLESCEILPVGAATVGLRGESMAPVAEMFKGGAVAVGDAGHWIKSTSLMRRLLEYCGDFNIPVLSRPSDPEVARSGEVHEGEVSTALGLRGIPRTAEELAVARDLLVAEHTGGAVHLSGISTAGSVRMVREAKARGVRVSADANPLHLLLTHESLFGFPVTLKVRPPLRESADRMALIEGLKDGTLDCLASHHAPQSVMEKDSTFQGAEFGATGLQTAISLALALVREHDVPALTLVRALSHAPASVLGLDVGHISEGAEANLTVIDPTGTWTLDASSNRSKSAYCYHFGKTLQGRVHQTVKRGRLLVHEGADASL